MEKEKIGFYLTKPIYFIGINDFENYENCLVANSLILLILKNKWWERTRFSKFLRTLEADRPLSVGVSGIRVKEAFDVLIDELANPKIEEHIMTNVFDDENDQKNVYGFLVSQTPDGERWNDWQDYLVIVVGDDKEIIEIKRMINSRWTEKKYGPRS